MGCTVFAEGQGLFHKGSGGSGIGPADVCLTPPPPPAGPIPVPYVNNVSAGDLADGSSSVKADGEPTALEDKSNVSTSTGDEAGTQGGNVITHKTKGKGYFKMWSFTVKAEGKGVCRNSDPMAQNCASSPPGCVNPAAMTKFKKYLEDKGAKPGEPCDPNNYNGSQYVKQTPAQENKVRGGPCWQCAEERAVGGWSGPIANIIKKTGKQIAAKPARGKRQGFTNFSAGEYHTPDHQPPQKVAWEMGGCHLSDDEWKEFMEDESNVIPHCDACSRSQGGTISHKTPTDIQGYVSSF